MGIHSVAKPGDKLTAGETLGTTPEGIFTHRIMVPFKIRGKVTVESIVPAGEHVVEDVIAKLKDADARSSKSRCLDLAVKILSATRNASVRSSR